MNSLVLYCIVFVLVLISSLVVCCMVGLDYVVLVGLVF